MLVAVVPGTGNQGSSVTLGLAAKGHSVRAVVRNPTAPKAQNMQFQYADRIQLVQANLDDLGSLVKAFQGVDVVYASTPDGPDDIRQGQTIADAALAARVKLIIWSTGVDVQAVTKGKIVGVGILEKKVRIEEYIKELGLNHVFLRIGDFYENILTYGLISYDKVTNEITLVTGGKHTHVPVEAAYVRQDLGRVVELIISNTEHFQTGDNTSAYFDNEKEKDYVHFASQVLSYQQMAAIIGEKSGKKVNIVDTPPFFPELGLMLEYLKDYGGWGKHAPVPDPKLTSIGFKPTPYEKFVVDDVLPFLGL